MCTCGKFKKKSKLENWSRNLGCVFRWTTSSVHFTTRCCYTRLHWTRRWPTPSWIPGTARISPAKCGTGLLSVGEGTFCFLSGSGIRLVITWLSSSSNTQVDVHALLPLPRVWRRFLAISARFLSSSGCQGHHMHKVAVTLWVSVAGITGNVSIDENGDRYSDYSLLDLDPDEDKFVVKISAWKFKKYSGFQTADQRKFAKILIQEVAYYSGASNSLKTVQRFHWVKGQPPKDTPICGWDNSKCPDGLPMWAYMVIALASLTIIFTILSFFIWRYHPQSSLSANSLYKNTISYCPFLRIFHS